MTVATDDQVADMLRWLDLEDELDRRRHPDPMALVQRIAECVDDAVACGGSPMAAVVAGAVLAGLDPLVVARVVADAARRYRRQGAAA